MNKLDVGNHDSDNHGTRLITLQELLAFREDLKKSSPKAYLKFKKLTINSDIDYLKSAMDLKAKILNAEYNKLDHDSE